MGIFQHWPEELKMSPKRLLGAALAGLAGLGWLGNQNIKYPNVTQNLSDLKFSGRAQPMARCRATAPGWLETGRQIWNSGSVKQST